MSRRRVARPIAAAVAIGALALPALAREPAHEAAFVVAAPSLARACDTEAMNAEPTAVRTAALAPATSRVTLIHAQATTAEGAALDHALAAATSAPSYPTPGAAEAVRIPCLAGRIEARTGQAAPTWPDRLASN